MGVEGCLQDVEEALAFRMDAFCREERLKASYLSICASVISARYSLCQNLNILYTIAGQAWQHNDGRPDACFCI